MKRLLFIPMLFVCFVSLGQTVNPASIIGKSVRIGNLEVAQFDFPDSMNWDDAQKACAGLGNGWRLPTHDELDVLYQNAEKIDNFFRSYYWSSTESVYGYAWYVGFTLSNQPFYNEFTPVYVRAVRAF
jgi:hypothetical protein